MKGEQLDLLGLLTRLGACEACGAKPHEHTEIGRMLRRPPACDLSTAEASRPLGVVA